MYGAVRLECEPQLQVGVESSASLRARCHSLASLHSSRRWKELRLGADKTRSPVRTRISVGGRAWRLKAQVTGTSAGGPVVPVSYSQGGRCGVCLRQLEQPPLKPAPQLPARPFRLQAPLVWCDTGPAPADARVAGSGRSASFCHLQP